MALEVPMGGSRFTSRAFLAFSHLALSAGLVSFASAEDGKILWRTRLDGAPGGGIITDAVDGEQRVAFAVGTNSPIWPVEKKTAKIVVFGR